MKISLYACCLVLLLNACDNYPNQAARPPAAKSLPPNVIIARYETVKKELAPLAPLRQAAPPATPGAWRAFTNEQQQSPLDYARYRPVAPSTERPTLYIATAGKLSSAERQMVALIKNALTANFQCPVKEAPPISNIVLRRYSDLERQKLNSVQFTSRIRKTFLPPDAWALLAITAEPIFKMSAGQPLFGDTLLYGRIGVMTLAHFKNKPAMAARSVKLALHEASHLLSLKHCVENVCLLNGVLSLAEVDRWPLYYCPACLQKLTLHAAVNVRQRLRAMRSFSQRHGFALAASHYRQALELLPAE